MNDINKICFAYPTLLQPDEPSEQGYIPDPLIAGIEKGSEHTVVVTVGLMISVDLRIFTFIDILLDGKIISLDEGDSDGHYENLKVNYIDDSQVILLSSMHVKDVKFHKSGTYEIRIKLFEVDDDGVKKGDVIDCYSSYFHVLVKDGE
ncbi:hypothetical protein [Pectobacterium parmentieri]|uniref:Uncharacterized protein n=1 Tax=Pectobacterium parmentieri TaxID=1905730 RepID=A0A8B3F8Y2_PECPM|nr:hypothetical protein [Pectobacterium parmentieri]AOR58851.1 hypothetical protein A8F97_08020 [Pectobacterium parmentieri]AYH10112.1 hypothetical protein C5E24_10680 [Pectobacterium parmentieri]AYH19177.1 hypothetical protein C5E22_12110 [Pectobacterium parmentieri]AYH36431.1 hypothetical protein C5E17_10625 [Pectobacterium parmentieri]AZS56537.1 hypothetical protein C5E18_10625 [Pectobacterium parmentieri]